MQKKIEEEDNWGLLAVINLYDCDKDLIQESAVLKKFVKSLCQIIEMKPVGDPIVGSFGEGKLYGHSAMQFIETSSITVHCDSKISNRVFIDIFSCKNFDAPKAAYYCCKFFKAQGMNFKVIERD